MSTPMNFAPVPLSNYSTYANRSVNASANRFAQPGPPTMSYPFQASPINPLAASSSPRLVNRPPSTYHMTPTYNPRLGATSAYAFKKGIGLGAALIGLPLFWLFSLVLDQRHRSARSAASDDSFWRNADWERESYQPHEIDDASPVGESHLRHRDSRSRQEAADEDYARELSFRDRLSLGRWDEDSRPTRRLNDHTPPSGYGRRDSASSLSSIQEDTLSRPVRQKLVDLRAILADQPGNLSHVFINANRSRSRDTELCFTFADADRFPAAQRDNEDYSMGTLQFFIPTASIPPQALMNINHLKQWLNLPQIRNSVNFRVQG